MALNLTTWFAISILLIAVFGIISNTSPTGLSNIQVQFNALTCPLPSITGVWNNTGTIQYSPQSGNPTYNYPDKDNQTLTFTCTYVHTLDSYDYLCGAPFGSFCGVLIFAGDFLSEIFHKMVAFFTLIAFFLTPINFNILGFTIAEIGGQALMFVIGLYAFAYIGIGAFFGSYIVNAIKMVL